MVKFLKKLGHDTSGATAVEYGLILALIFLAMIGGVEAFGTEAIRMWSNTSNTIAAAIGA